FFLAFLARSFCLFISLSKPTSSIVKPKSFTCSSVNSLGKPKVSYNLNTSSPGMTVFPSLVSCRSEDTRLNSSHVSISYAVFFMRSPSLFSLFPYTTLFRSCFFWHSWHVLFVYSFLFQNQLHQS